MKKVRYLLCCLTICLISTLTITNVSAASYKSTLDLPYGDYLNGTQRYYEQGDHRIMISIDGFNTKDKTVRKSGSSFLSVGLVINGYRFLKVYDENPLYGTCMILDMGTQYGGRYGYAFFAYDADDNYKKYDGTKSDKVIMESY